MKRIKIDLSRPKNFVLCLWDDLLPFLFQWRYKLMLHLFIKLNLVKQKQKLFIFLLYAFHNLKVQLYQMLKYYTRMWTTIDLELFLEKLGFFDFQKMNVLQKGLCNTTLNCVLFFCPSLLMIVYYSIYKKKGTQ
jgi:hypothetical protein